MTVPRPSKFLADLQDASDWLTRLHGFMVTPNADRLTSIDRMAHREADVYPERSDNPGKPSGHGDPTGNAALTPHAHPLTDAAKLLDEIKVRLSKLEALHSFHSPPGTGRVDNEPGCQACAKHRNHDGNPVWSQVWRTGTVAGRLDVSTRLCRWDYEHVMATGELAAEDIREQYLAGKNPVIRKAS